MNADLIAAGAIVITTGGPALMWGTGRYLLRRHTFRYLLAADQPEAELQPEPAEPVVLTRPAISDRHVVPGVVLESHEVPYAS